MSYSFSVQGSSKDEVLKSVKAELDKVVASQPVHQADVQQVMASAKSFLAVLGEDPARNISGSISGSIWQSDGVTQGCSVSINFGLVVKPGVSA